MTQDKGLVINVTTGEVQTAGQFNAEDYLRTERIFSNWLDKSLEEIDVKDLSPNQMDAVAEEILRITNANKEESNDGTSREED